MITTVFGADQGYQKLGSTRLLPIGSSRLMEGRDHLLHVELRGVHEIQKRFYFSEIRAMSVQRTRTGAVLHILFGSSAAILGIGLATVLLTDSPVLARLTQLIVGLLVVLAGIWLIHFLRGPTCSFHLITAVQNERIPALWRLSVTTKALERLAPRIQSAQSQLDPAVTAPSEGAPAGPTQVPLFTAPEPSPPTDARWARPMAMALFSICLANAAVLFGNLLRTHPAFDVAETLLLLALLGVPLLAIVGNRANRILRLLGWVALGLSVLTFMGWYAVQLWETIARNQTQSAVWHVGSSPYSSPYTLWMTVGSATWSFMLGLAGWLVIVLQNREPARQEAGGLPPTPGFVEGSGSRENEP